MENRELGNAFSKPLIRVSSDASIATAACLMARHRIRHLPVFQDEKIVGMISDRDVQQAAQVRVSKWDDFRIQEKDFDPAHRVCDFMSSPVVSVSAQTTIEKIAAKMIEGRISSLLVLEGDQAVGIVTSEDLLRTIAGN